MPNLAAQTPVWTVSTPVAIQMVDAKLTNSFFVSCQQQRILLQRGLLGNQQLARIRPRLVVMT
jgi:hypothetical protein